MGMPHEHVRELTIIGVLFVFCCVFTNALIQVYPSKLSDHHVAQGPLCSSTEHAYIVK